MVFATSDKIRRGKLLVPPLNSTVIRRPRVFALLDEALDVPLTLITSPPGYGKTTALVGWLETVSCKSAWLTMDKDDADLARFFSHLVAAVQEAFPDFGVDFLSHLKSSNSTSEAAGRSLAEELFDLPEDLILVLDDLHEVPGHEVDAFIAEILSFPSPKLHLVISSRWDPQVSLARQRVRGQLLEVRAADLRFTFDETRSFLQAVLATDADEHVIFVLHDRTEGWIAGLRLASIALRSAADAEKLSELLVSSGDRHVMGFLMDEMLSRQPEDMQRFLVGASIVDKLCGSLAEAILDLPSNFDSFEAVLEHLSQTYVYEECEGDGSGWYRCHPLFRTLLRQRLAATVSAEKVRELYQRAGDWFASQERIGDAIRCALDAGNGEQAAGLVERWRLAYLGRERWVEVGDWLKLLSHEEVTARPLLLVTSYRTSSYRRAGSGVTAAGREVAARIARQQTPMDDEQRRLLEAEIALVELESHYLGGDHREFIATAERVLANLSPEDNLGRGTAIFAMITALHAQGDTERALALAQESLWSQVDESGAFSSRVLLAEATIHLQGAELIQAERVAHYALRIATDMELELVGNWTRFVLGYVAYESNDLDGAESYFAKIVAERERGHYVCVREAMFGLALIARARGDAERMNANVEAVLEWTLSHGVLSDLAIIEAFQARLGLLRGQPDEVGRWLSLPTPAAIGHPLWFEMPLLTRVRALLIDGHPDRIDAALEHLDALELWAASSNTRLRLVEIEALRALAHLARGDEDSAANAMARSLGLAGTEPFARTFQDLGLDIEPLMRLVRSRRRMPEQLERFLDVSRNGQESQWRPPANTVRVETRPSPSTQHGRERSIHVYELLTEREAEVLQLLSEQLTNREIAESLFISPLTVKRHASNIYGKLGVGSRRQALIRATELGYLPSR